MRVLLRQGGRILAGEDAQTEIPISDASAPPSLPDLDSAAKYAPTPCGSSSRRTARTRVRLPLPMQRRRLHPCPITFDGKGSLPGEKKSSRDGRPPPGLRVFRADRFSAPVRLKSILAPAFRNDGLLSALRDKPLDAGPCGWTRRESYGPPDDKLFQQYPREAPYPIRPCGPDWSAKHRPPFPRFASPPSECRAGPESLLCTFRSEPIFAFANLGL